MTTEVKRGPCATDRCELCGWIQQGHEFYSECSEDFKPHQHTVECSARFYREFFGCASIVLSSDQRLICLEPTEEGHRELRHADDPADYDYHALPDILGSPESDASWLAMRDVLREIERQPSDVKRLFEAELAKQCAVVYPFVEYGLSVVLTDGWLPRAVALAAWQAVSDD